jgi:hypothetical protein
MSINPPDLLAPLVVRVPPPATVPVPRHLYERLHAAIRIANQAVVADVESNCPSLLSPCDRLTWYDVRPMLDEREHSPPVVDMAREAIAYGVDTGVLVRHTEYPHMVRVARPGC